MPELPEVSVVIIQLIKAVKNKTIKNVNVLTLKVIKEIEPIVFQTQLKNQTINKISRVGKFIVFHLTNNLILLSHLRMEGKYSYYLKPTTPEKHTHLVFQMTDNSELHYHDTRIFGTFHIRTRNNYLKILPLSKIAPEPKKIDPVILFNRLQKKNIAIKTALLDQTIISGLGNIYVDEVLFLTKIHPLSPAKNLSLDQVKSIVKRSVIIFKEAIKRGGTTIQSYSSLNQKTGYFQLKLVVHRRAKQPCLVCQNLIIKIKVNGRGTYFCQSCQKLFN